MNTEFIVGLILVSAITIVAVIITRRAHKKRVAAFTQAAQIAGYTYLGKPDKSFKSLLFQASIFSGGTQKRLNYAVSGKHEGIEFSAFELKYNLGDQTNYAHTACFRIDSRRIPPFELRAEATTGDWLATFFGSSDIDFEQDERFSNRYVLKGGDTHAIRDLFPSDYRKRLAQTNLSPRIEAVGDWLICAPGLHQRLDPQELTAFVDRAHSLVEPILDANR
jgi:hypothetical protein